MKSIQHTLFMLLMAALLPATASSQEFVINGDFESDVEDFIVRPGYVGGTNADGDMNPNEIPDWTGDGGEESTRCLH